MGDAAERLFGGPQDMEWTYRDGRFHLVQSRDITRPVAGDADMAAMQNDLARAVDIAKGASPDQVVFAQERAVGNAAAADAAVAVAHGSRCGRPAAASIWPRASSASPTASRTARTIS